MIIFLPLKYTRLTQPFGANNACVDNNKRVVSKRGKTCPAGYRPLYEALRMKGHNGEDWGSYRKQKLYFPIVAECDFVARYDKDSAGGVGLDCFSKERVHFEELPKGTGKQAKKEWENNGKKLYVKFRFWHAQSNVVEDGDTVRYGDLIQLADSSGLSSGDHLHWGMKFVDADGNTLDKWNGYTGSVDFSMWRKNQFILDFLDRDPEDPVDGETQMNRAIWILRYNMRNFVGAFQLQRIKELLVNLKVV